MPPRMTDGLSINKQGFRVGYIAIFLIDMAVIKTVNVIMTTSDDAITVNVAYCGEEGVGKVLRCGQFQL